MRLFKVIKVKGKLNNSLVSNKKLLVNIYKHNNQRIYCIYSLYKRDMENLRIIKRLPIGSYIISLSPIKTFIKTRKGIFSYKSEY